MDFVVRAHAGLSHFPIALIMVSFVASIVVRFRPDWRIDSFWPLVGGVVAAILSVGTGIVVHEPYEHLPIISEIQVHQFTAMAGTAVTALLVVLRWRARGQGTDLDDKPWYLAIAAAGIVWVAVVGYTGGDLVYEHGINVEAVDPLRAAEH